MKKRIISGLILIAIAIPLFIFGGIPFKVGMVLLAILAYKETLHLNNSHNTYPNYIMIIGLLCLIGIVLGRSADYGVSFLFIAIPTLILAIPAIKNKNDSYKTKEYFYLLGSIVFIGLFFNIAITIFEANKWVLLYIVLIATLTDTFAYVIGRLIGKHKLIPEVSPKKTWEGSIGGSLVGGIVTSIFYYNIITPEISIILLVIMSFSLSVLGQLGDLFFSKIKRENSIKDFSNLILGHGGILDRFDSLTFIMFGYIIIVSLLNIIR